MTHKILFKNDNNSQSNNNNTTTKTKEKEEEKESIKEIQQKNKQSLTLIKNPKVGQTVWSEFINSKTNEHYWLSGIIDKVCPKTCSVTYSDNQQLKRTPYHEIL